MSRQPPLLERLKRARVFQVLAVYLGASWVVLQIADVLQDAVGLPAWVSAFAVLLLLIGLIIILSTAWVQSLPKTTALEEAGEIPTDWEIAPGDVIDSLKRGRVPHLTWGRAIMGGVVALSLLFGGAGLYVGLTGRPGVLGPAELGAGEAATGIAVMPFVVTGGEDLELWREGMVDILSTNLDGMGGFRTIDSRTVLSEWQARVPEGEQPPLRTTLEVAASTGARYAVVGTMVGNPAGVRLGADVYDLSSRDEVAQVTREGASNEVLELTSALSVDLTRELLGTSGRGAVQDLRLDALTTTSLPALRAYLEGEAAFRDAAFADAVAAYEQAVALDSLFALAWLRLSSSYGWLDNIGSASAAVAGERALALVDRLPARDRIIVRASEAARTGDVSFFPEARESVRLYPDDPDLWFELGEYIFHVGLAAGVATMEQGMEAFQRAMELDPDFGPYQVHPLELTIASGDSEAANRALERYRASTDDSQNVREFELAIPLLLGSEDAAEQAIVGSRGIDMGTLARVRIAFQNKQDRYDRLSALEWANRDRAGADHQWLYYQLGAQGALERAGRVADSLDLSAGVKGVGAGYMMGVWPDASHERLRDLATSQRCLQPAVDVTCLGFVGWGFARAGELEEAAAVLDHLRRLAADDGGRVAGVWAKIVEGAVVAERGRPGEARTLLLTARNEGAPAGVLARLSLAELEQEEGNIPEAISYHLANLYDFGRVRSTYQLARIYDERADDEEAARYYRSFLTATREGDQELREIRAAKEALARLGG